MITIKPITSVACVISLRGEPNGQEVELLADRLADLVAQGAQEIAIDLSGVRGVASSALLDVLTEAAEAIEATGGDLLLASKELNGSAYRLARLQPHRVERVRGLHPSLDAALTAAAALPSGGAARTRSRRNGL